MYMMYYFNLKKFNLSQKVYMQLSRRSLRTSDNNDDFDKDRDDDPTSRVSQSDILCADTISVTHQFKYNSKFLLPFLRKKI